MIRIWAFPAQLQEVRKGNGYAAHRIFRGPYLEGTSTAVPRPRVVLNYQTARPGFLSLKRGINRYSGGGLDRLLRTLRLNRAVYAPLLPLAGRHYRHFSTVHAPVCNWAEPGHLPLVHGAEEPSEVDVIRNTL